MTIKNVGSEIGSLNLILKVDGSIVGRRVVSLDPGDSRVEIFTYTPSKEGTFKIEAIGVFDSQKVTGPTRILKVEVIGIETQFIIAIVIIIAVLTLAFLLWKHKARNKRKSPATV